jgi:[ribosomal protein S18]-alanine N-acetyltransferase
MLAIRPLTVKDIDAVLKLEACTPEAPHWNRIDYERILAPEDEKTASRSAWVAVTGPDLLGYVVGHLVAGVCELESIVIDNSARRKRVGKSLMETLTHWALSSGAQKLELEVRAGNQSAIAFYESAGFLCEGLRPGYYSGPDEDAVLMGKRLYSDD